MKRLALVISLSLAIFAGLASIAIANNGAASATANNGTTKDCSAMGSGTEMGQHASMHAQMIGVGTCSQRYWRPS